METGEYPPPVSQPFVQTQPILRAPSLTYNHTHPNQAQANKSNQQKNQTSNQPVEYMETDEILPLPSITYKPPVVQRQPILRFPSLTYNHTPHNQAQANKTNQQKN